ncbi:MAG TPA: hypothetical protein PLJ60_05990 [Chryseolinea sp.]|nr:hypothetical protein [Chryseolinea sp.]HPM29869.1 hypothetical protein [Chryseolinea sp.]
MIRWVDYKKLPLDEKIDLLYEQGTFVMSIRYYRYKINLYLFENYYLEVFVNHKHASIEKITALGIHNTRMQFYSDQIALPYDLLQK